MKCLPSDYQLLIYHSISLLLFVIHAIHWKPHSKTEISPWPSDLSALSLTYAHGIIKTRTFYSFHSFLSPKHWQDFQLWSTRIQSWKRITPPLAQPCKHVHGSWKKWHALVMKGTPVLFIFNGQSLKYAK
jgi:hypothetical protein